jgi:hypothetical protein
MPRIRYVDVETIEDPEIKGYLERARRHGTPRPENGVIDHRIKELCRVYVSQSIDCHY